MTVKEIIREIDADQFRFDRDKSVLGNAAAIIANPHYKNKIRSRDIYKPQSVDYQEDQEKRHKNFKETVESMKQKVDQNEIPIDTSNIEGVD